MDIVLGARDQTGAGITSAEGKLARLKGDVSGLMSAWAGFGAASTAAVGFLSDAANAAANDAASTDRLRKAVENTGASWEKTQGAIEARIAANQDLAFSDDQTRDSLALLLAQTGDVDEAMKRQKLAMDLARGANIDVVTAAKLLGKVTDENVNVLAKYGIRVDKGADQTALFAAVQQKFGGQAKVYGDSTAGSIAKIKDRIDEWKESIGAALGPAQQYIALLPGLSSGFSLAGAVIGPLAGKINFVAAATAAWNFVQDLNTFALQRGYIGTLKYVAGLALHKAATFAAATASKAWAIAQIALNFVLSANPIGLVVLAIAALAAGVIWAYKNVGPFRTAVDAAFASMKVWGAWIGAVLRPVLQWLGDRVQQIAKFIGQIISTAQGLAKTAHDLHVPGFDWGGKVPGPIGAPMLIEAHGGETVLTAGESRMRESAMAPTAAAGNTVQIDIHIGSYVGDASQLSKILARELRLAGAFA